MTFDEIVNQLNKKDLKPVYFLHGEEPYYIDQLVDLAANSMLTEAERGFNQTVFYGKDAAPLDIMDTLMRFPMMAEKQVVILKEAQELKPASAWEVFEKYFESPVPSTVFIIAHKYKSYDKRSRIYKTLKKNAVVFESEAVKEYQLAAWINRFIQEKKYQITAKATALLIEFIGNDLSRIANELEKLFILIPQGNQITEQHIEQHIGISKDYNVFELVNAVLERDILKANKIVLYFGQNPKATHITIVLANLYNLYQRLFKVHFAKTEDPRQIASLLGIHPYPAKELVTNKRKHPPKIISRNFSILREYDLYGKGVDSAGVPENELLRELIYKLLH